MFTEILETLNTGGRGSQGYGKAIEVALNCMKSDPERATGYLLLIVQAEQFIENTGRLAITSAQTKRAYEGFAANAATLKDAYATDDATAIVKALNAVSLKVLEPLDSSFPAIS